VRVRACMGLAGQTIECAYKMIDCVCVCMGMVWHRRRSIVCVCMYGYGVAQEMIDCVCVYVWVWCGTGDDRLCIDITMTFDRLCMYTYRMSPACFHKYIYCLLELNILCDCVTQVFIIHTICCVYIHIICHDRLCMHTHHMP